MTISRCGPTGVPLDRIADELEAAGTARVSMDVLVQKVPAIPQQRGLWDFERELGILRFMRKDTPVDLLHAGPDIYRLLSPQEQKATGKLWRWEERRPSNWATDHAETIASIRHLAHSTNLERTEHDVVRYALRITTRPDARDPLLASLHEQVRQFGIKDLAVNVWMTTDGRLCQIRERMKTTRAEIIRDHWDFGVDLPYLAVPPPEQILHEDGGPGGLTVLIDDEPSPY